MEIYNPKSLEHERRVMIIQKLEIGAGIITSFIMFLCFAGLTHLLFNLRESSGGEEFVAIMSLFCFFSVIIAVSAYYHAAKNSNSAFFLLLISEICLISISCFFALLVAVAGGGVFALIIFFNLIPALITLALAINLRAKLASGN